MTFLVKMMFLTPNKFDGTMFRGERGNTVGFIFMMLIGLHIWGWGRIFGGGNIYE